MMTIMLKTLPTFLLLTSKCHIHAA